MEYGLIGEHLGHSFSKDIHALIGDYSYELNEISKENLDSFMKKKDFKAINVTIPYKQDVIPYLAWIDPNAQEIGAVNTIVNRNGKLYGYNTDFYGLKNLIIYNKINLKNKKVLVLGTGGTSKTACSVAKSLGAKQIIKVSRNESDSTITYEQAISIHNDAQIIINTTPSGMFPYNETCPINLENFPKLKGVVDAVYNPLRTSLVLKGKELNVKASGGLFMLVHQAVKASEFFFDTTIPVQKGINIFREILYTKENIVLIGMPGSGKSTIGFKLAKKLNRPFYDCDELIYKTTGKKPDQIINENGVDYFRDVESQVIKDISKEQCCVISTGGGAVLRMENVNALKQNSIIIFIERKLKNIKPTKDRPLSNSKEKLKQLYKKRLPLYKKAMDISVKNNGNVYDTIKSILRKLEK